MEVEEDDFKTVIVPKIQKSTEDLVNNKHSRVLLSDFNSIKKYLFIYYIETIRIFQRRRRYRFLNVRKK